MSTQSTSFLVRTLLDTGKTGEALNLFACYLGRDLLKAGFDFESLSISVRDRDDRTQGYLITLWKPGRFTPIGKPFPNMESQIISSEFLGGRIFDSATLDDIPEEDFVFATWTFMKEARA